MACISRTQATSSCSHKGTGPILSPGNENTTICSVELRIMRGTYLYIYAIFLVVFFLHVLFAGIVVTPCGSRWIRKIMSTSPGRVLGRLTCPIEQPYGPFLLAYRLTAICESITFFIDYVISRVRGWWVIGLWTLDAAVVISVPVSPACRACMCTHCVCTVHLAWEWPDQYTQGPPKRRRWSLHMRHNVTYLPHATCTFPPILTCLPSHAHVHWPASPPTHMLTNIPLRPRLCSLTCLPPMPMFTDLPPRDARVHLAASPPTPMLIDLPPSPPMPMLTDLPLRLHPCSLTCLPPTPVLTALPPAHTRAHWPASPPMPVLTDHASTHAHAHWPASPPTPVLTALPPHPHPCSLTMLPPTPMLTDPPPRPRPCSLTCLPPTPMLTDLHLHLHSCSLPCLPAHTHAHWPSSPPIIIPPRLRDPPPSSLSPRPPCLYFPPTPMFSPAQQPACTRVSTVANISCARLE